ncbi:hypothetical protein GCM10009839_60900 [Catenulispora yoronensis]|uniref:Trypsin-co-occurring domain-containing protein n=1 Tax=Catenulispora yoronensis TaxID=450799 RepID=A0ABN2V0M5_9ACTN
MPDFLRFDFDDGTSVLMKAVPAAELDLPPGTEPLEPVSRVKDTLAKAGSSLAESLRPLVPVLESVHRTVLKAARPPDKVSVELGLKLTSEMHLMIVGANGEASLTVKAEWDLHRDAQHGDAQHQDVQADEGSGSDPAAETEE